MELYHFIHSNFLLKNLFSNIFQKSLSIIESSKVFYYSKLTSHENILIHWNHLIRHKRKWISKKKRDDKAESFVSASTGGMSAPSVESVSPSSVNVHGTVVVRLSATRRVSWIASCPVDVIDLEQSNIKSTIRVVVHGVCVSSRLVADNAFATVLVPTVFWAPSTNILHVFRCSTRAAWAFCTRAVSSTSVCKWNHKNEDKAKKNLHKVFRFKFITEIYNLILKLIQIFLEQYFIQPNFMHF